MGEYKNSNIDWIGNIPIEWDIQPLGIYFDERREKVSDTDFEPLSVTKGGIVKQLENVAKSDAHDDRKKVCKNDFVINSRSDRKQSCGLSEYDGSVSLINTVLIPNTDKLLPKYVKYLFDNCMFAEEFYRNGHGIVADLWTTNFSDMKRISIPIPPINEQIKISNELDNKIPKVNKILENLNKQINILNQYRRSKMTEVLTKGLNPNAEMKESRIDWLGKIPKHWAVNKLRYVTTLRQEKSIYSKKNDIYIGLENIESSTGKYIETDSIYDDGIYDAFKKGDILFNKLRPYLLKIMYANFDGFCTGELAIIKETTLYKKYLYYYLYNDGFMKMVDSSTYGTKMPRANWDYIKTLAVLIPSYEEQVEISKYLDNELEKIYILIEKKKQQIVQLENYKKSLIYEYVTGKKRVKGE